MDSFSIKKKGNGNNILSRKLSDFRHFSNGNGRRPPAVRSKHRSSFLEIRKYTTRRINGIALKAPTGALSPVCILRGKFSPLQVIF